MTTRRTFLFQVVPAAAAVLLFLFLMPFKTVAPDNQFAQNEPSEPQVLADSIVNTVDSIKIEEKPQLDKNIYKKINS